MEMRFAKLILLQLHLPGALVPGPPLHPVAFSWAGFTEATSKEVWAHARLPQAIVNTAIHRIGVTRTPDSPILTPSAVSVQRWFVQRCTILDKRKVRSF